jgi:hypothetical protein
LGHKKTATGCSVAAFLRVGKGVLIAYNCPRENLSFLEFIRIPYFRWVNKYGSSAYNLHVAVGVLYQSTKFLVFVRPKETLIKATLPGFFVREAATPKFASS